ncbi:glycosyltransferase [Sphingobacteriaceae bacterium WQ 2009]|uniref:Glycosyltransferase n=1 Tax=Rhinopithecimicrobium faecis TaxID=2820698 RepID=A0A8T4HA02_9SPHI|nr:glycosyltransferase [Sphingobacteriaceae bacterium WQ 2009]
MLDFTAIIPYLSYISLGILGLLFLIQLYYILFVYGKLSAYKVTEHSSVTDYPPISVIICGKNEQDNITQFLPKILNQEYPNYEVIFVNDFSEDDTEWELKRLSEIYSHLKVVEIKEHIRLKHGKKFAVTLGIKASKNELLVFTDADCQPQSELWLQEMALSFTDKKDIVLGYSPYIKLPGLLNALIRFETSHTAMSYLSYALKGDAYMGVGRNMAYRKSLFFQAKGFAKHMHIKSGDDDLFVNQNATPTNVVINIHPNAQLLSLPKITWKSYYTQKARHSGASVIYKKRHQRMLATQLISAFLFYCALVAVSIAYPSYWYIPLSAYLLRLIAQVIIFKPIYKKLQVPDLIWWLPLLDLLYYFYICINGAFNRKRKSVRWK